MSRLSKYFLKSRYLIRLDDASEFSDLKKWKKIESILDNNNVKPIVAVIPKNEDKLISYSNSNKRFWELIRSWDKKGWAIAMHGYKHLFHEVNRKSLIFPFYNRSEFGGLSVKSQKQIIKKSLKIFKSKKVLPTVWIAPAHSFDENTIKAISEETSINIISDGIAFFPYFLSGFYFIPQQIWELKERLFGIWTVCLHPDTMTENEILFFEKQISLFNKNNRMLNIEDVDLIKRNKSIIDNLFSFIFWLKYDTSSLLRPYKNYFK